VNKKTRTRRLRRKAHAIVKHGPGAGPKHKLRSGRTGMLREDIRALEAATRTVR